MNELIHATHHTNGTVADASRKVYRYVDYKLTRDKRNGLNMSEEYNTVGLHHIIEFNYPNTGIITRKFYVPSSNALTEIH